MAARSEENPMKPGKNRRSADRHRDHRTPEQQNLTSRVQVALPRMHLGVLGGQALVGPAEPLGRENDPVAQRGEPGQQLIWTGRQDHIVAAETEQRPG